MSAKLTDFVEFNAPALKARYGNSGKRMPMNKWVEAFLDGDLDLKVDMGRFLEHKDELVSYPLMTQEHLRFFLSHFVPEVIVHSKAQDRRIARDHYDRGNDFFGWFLGPLMVYTSAFFKSEDETLEEAQLNKLELVCDKIQLKAGERHLDIGCGWGPLVAHAARERGADSTGITICEKQTAFANELIEREGIADRARVHCLDYREIPDTTYDKITCLEMAEHVGVLKFQAFMNQVYDLLADDGIFYLQIAGLRRPKGSVTKHMLSTLANLKPTEDLVWGLFMNKYVFPGADASMPLSWVCKKLETAGFEIHSVENVGIHYSLTIQRWFENWQANREAIVEVYGERWYRQWLIFLGWSVQIAARGASTCFQLVCHKNLDHYARRTFIGAPSLGEQAHVFDEEKGGNGELRVS